MSERLLRFGFFRSNLQDTSKRLASGKNTLAMTDTIMSHSVDSI